MSTWLKAGVLATQVTEWAGHSVDVLLSVYAECISRQQDAAKERILKVLEQRGRELAIRVQNELGTEGWEVFYHLDGRVHRVHPPGSWPEETWEQDLLGYAPRGHRRQQAEP